MADNIEMMPLSPDPNRVPGSGPKLKGDLFKGMTPPPGLREKVQADLDAKGITDKTPEDVLGSLGFTLEELVLDAEVVDDEQQ